MCVVSDDKNPCHLAEAPGPCRGLVNRYLFDSKIQQCRSFFYGGCFGNANNFRTMAECQAKCLNPAKPTTEPEIQTQAARKAGGVQPTIVTGELTASEPLVQLNDSNQETRDDLSPSEQCFSPVDRGTCHGVEKRFAYNSEIKRCQVFIYSGCGGNRNNFTSRKHCIHKCIKSRRGHGRRMIRIRKKNLDSIVNRSVWTPGSAWEPAVLCSHLYLWQNLFLALLISFVFHCISRQVYYKLCHCFSQGCNVKLKKNLLRNNHNNENHLSIGWYQPA